LKKKDKNKNTPKKARLNRVEHTFKLSKEGTYKVVLNPEKGLELWNENGELVQFTSQNSQLYYNRDTKPKIITYSNTSISPNENASHILRNYEYLSAIDTNTRLVHGRLVSVSVICLGRWINHGEKTEFSFYHDLYMDTFDYEGKPERFAWCEFIKLIVKGDSYIGNDTFGIIVDSELGEISEINSRKIPLYKDYYLPERMYLIYASADKSETVQNYIINKCDQLATDRLDFLEKRYTSDEFNKVAKNYNKIFRIENNSA